MYDEAMEGVVENLIVKSPGGLTYACSKQFNNILHEMQHLACFTGKSTSICHTLID